MMLALQNATYRTVFSTLGLNLESSVILNLLNISFMLINRNILLPVLIGLSWLTSCGQDDDSIACKPVDNISAPGTCYEPSRGLTLVASGQTNSADRSQFTWSVFLQSDTTLTNDISASREKILV